MTTEQLFSLCNTLALVSWIALIAGPRRAFVIGAIRWGVITGLAALYAVLIAVYFFRVEGGGFFSLAAVQTLFSDRHVALAGWIHYLAFDLFVGLWVAARADALGIHRLVQAPIMVTTFMFGPLGYLLFQGANALARTTQENGEKQRSSAP